MCIGDCASFRDKLLEAERLVEAVVLNLKNPANMTLLSNFAWVASNLVRGKPQPRLEVVKPLVDELCKLVTKVSELAKRAELEEKQADVACLGDRSGGIDRRILGALIC